MKLYELMSDYVQALDIPNKDAEVCDITDDSRAEVTKNTVFVCVKGKTFDGHSAAKDMLDKGCCAVICGRDLGLDNQIIVSDTRAAYSRLCAKLCGNPEKKLNLIAATGTNGKTTTTTLIRDILEDCNYKTGLIGTIRNEIRKQPVERTGDNTTPLPRELYKIFSQMLDAGCDTVVMEASSFGLEQDRMGDCRFKVGIFTNLTQDHLDYHETMENYYQAKKRLFDGRCDVAVINTDDEYGRRLYEEISCKKYSYGMHGADFTAKNAAFRADGIDFTLEYNGMDLSVSAHLTGTFNVMNLTAALACCILMGNSPEDVIAAASECTGVKGRCEIIPTGLDFTVINDYAHTPDAIENILSAVRDNTKGRLTCLFGCGGNRDAKKRPLMAAAAAKYADRLIITSDNPRNEDPEAIIAQIIEGVPQGKTYEKITDRRQAIYHALKTAESGETIVLAGKGHEDYQILPGNVHIHFDEREIVAEGLKLLR